MSTESQTKNACSRSRKMGGTKRNYNHNKKLMMVIMMVLAVFSSWCPTTEAAGLFSWESLWESEETSGSNSKKTVSTLSMLEISEMRVRDIKRRLSRHHGYGADELSRMLDKQELINALSYEEHKNQQKEYEKKKRIQLKRSIIVALFCVIVVICKPLLFHAWEVSHVNWVVYTDKKKYEISKCMEYASIKGCLGVFAMMLVDLCKLWISVSVLLSWVLSSSSPYRTYLFPTPNVPIRPAEMLAVASGNPGKAGPLGNYGINIGPMIIRWIFGYVHYQVEAWTGKVLSKAYQQQRKAMKKVQKQQEKEAEKEARRAARRERRAEREKQKQKQQQQQSESGSTTNHPPQPEETNTNVNANDTINDDFQNNIEEKYQLNGIHNENRKENGQYDTYEVSGMDELD